MSLSVIKIEEFWSMTLYTNELTNLELYDWFRKLPDFTQLQIEKRKTNSQDSRLLLDDSGNFPDLKKEFYVTRIFDDYHRRPAIAELFDYVFHGSVFEEFLQCDPRSNSTVACFFGSRFGKVPSKDFKDVIKDLSKENKIRTEAKKEFERMMSVHEKPGMSNDELRIVVDRILTQIAEKLGIRSGHWSTYYGEAEKEAKNTFQALLRGFFCGNLSESPATGIGMKWTRDGYSVSVRNEITTASSKPHEDFDVFKTEKAIRKDGLRVGLCQRVMKYKPDIVSACQIYHGNQEVMRPTVYKSKYISDPGEAKSIISTYEDGSSVQFEENLQWENRYE